jgi:hypothetical protein
MTKPLSIEYSEQGFGGIGYRLEIEIGEGQDRRRHSYTTNPEGSGLFFHNGRGDRRQTRGSGQFHARSLRDFEAKTARIVETYREEAGR